MLINVLGGNLFGFNLYIWYTLYNVCFCNVFINYADFYPLVQYSVSGSWFLASLLLSNPRFTLTLHYCCLADSAVSSISPPHPPHTATFLQQPSLFLQSTFNTTIFSHSQSWPILLCSCQNVTDAWRHRRSPLKRQFAALSITIVVPLLLFAVR